VATSLDSRFIIFIFVSQNRVERYQLTLALSRSQSRIERQPMNADVSVSRSSSNHLVFLDPDLRNPFDPSHPILSSAGGVQESAIFNPQSVMGGWARHRSTSGSRTVKVAPPPVRGSAMTEPP
jgi:hypothetical protein